MKSSKDEGWLDESSVRIMPYGASGALVDLGLPNHPRRAELTRRATQVLTRHFSGDEVVSGAGTIGLFAAARRDFDRETIARCLAGATELVQPGRVHEIPVVYDGADLEGLATELCLPWEEIVRLHTAQEFLCELVGFMPGFAYLGANPKELTVPRRSLPRARVPAGSVALGGAFSGIYPFESPGGWHLIGRNLGPMPFDPRREEPSLFRAGDRVRFTPVPQRDAPRSGRVLDIRFSLRQRPQKAGLIALEVPPLTTLQDEGRFGSLARGLARSGPLAPRLYHLTERSLKSRGAASLEIIAGPARFQAVGRVRVALDGAAKTLKDGETLVIPESEGWVRYLGIEHGFEADELLGSRSTLLTVGIGGYGGRALRRGDFIAASETSPEARRADDDAPSVERLSRGSISEVARVLIEPGPHLDHFRSSAFERLLESEYEVSPVSNRVGQRLIGPKIERLSTDTLLPTPMIRGAIEVPASGEPIVLGPDHPTTGGYPVLAVVRPESWDMLGRLRPGRRLRFGHWG